ncbi:hypothetical protein NDU88_008363 [Pleurodeles waltl]|uniref:Uncharacterized protein n=1 Tax=Pleurodeles waltl TaxID=8319 RepID=A0AAV7RTK5_PLEWA|nr:hypothetical protein NDU88_008363 [Pleurodeles waltl]
MVRMAVPDRKKPRRKDAILFIKPFVSLPPKMAPIVPRAAVIEYCASCVSPFSMSIAFINDANGGALCYFGSQRGHADIGLSDSQRLGEYGLVSSSLIFTTFDFIRAPHRLASLK